MTSQTSTVRLSKAARREQLLDSATDLLLERGPHGVTMEGVAVRAGVSKALPYIHFDNAEAVLVELYRREVRRLGAHVTTALGSEAEPPARIRAAVHGYFDAVIERGAVFSLLGGPGSAIPALADGGTRAGHRFVEDLFTNVLGLHHDQAPVAAGLFLGALTGGVELLAHGEAPRAAIEAAVVGVALHLAGPG